MKQNALEVKDLTVTYPEYANNAIENVTFSVEEGTMAALIGPNGSGKTSIIRSILGLIDYKGEIKVFGKPVHEARHTIGYVPQRFSFDPTFPVTVFEFISMVLSENTKKKHLISETLDYVEGTDLVGRKLSSLSGGQLQRVLLARALVKKPSLLLLDEPEAGVDIGGEQTFYDLMEKLVKDEKITALIASHELDIVYAYAQKAICVNKKMLCSGVPKEVLNQETFLELYGRGLKFFGHTGHHHS
jgi:ABC-type Mn2+/Zn2+ transport system ATPase subunit